MTTVADAPPRGRVLPPAADLLRTVVTAVLLALLAGWAFSAWWTWPRESDVAALDRAVAADEVRSFLRIERFEHEGLWINPAHPVSDPQGWAVLWQSTAGQTFYVVPEVPPAQPGTVVTGEPLEGARALARDLERAGVNQGFDGAHTAGLGMALVLGAFAVLVSGPVPPRRGTRWFWFWVGGVPFGLGVLAWILAERVRPPPHVVVVEGTKDLRWHGFAGVGVLFLASLALSTLVLPPMI